MAKNTLLVFSCVYVIEMRGSLIEKLSKPINLEKFYPGTVNEGTCMLYKCEDKLHPFSDMDSEVLEHFTCCEL